MALNHYAINKIMGGQMVHAGRMRFGRLGLGAVVGGMLKHRPRPNARVAFDIDADRVVHEAFVRTHCGASAESVLIDTSLAARFHSAARRLGLHASAADLNRRLLNLRKNPGRYKKFGLILPPATQTTPEPSIVPRYAHVIEFSLARLRLRYGVSIDDILIDPELGEEYERMVRSAAPSLTPREMRLAALYIRKTRYIAKQRAALIDSLDTVKIEDAFADVRDASALDAREGLVELLEDGRHLYISHNEDVRASAEQLTSESSLAFMANDFWQPKRGSLQVRVFLGHDFLTVPVAHWQLKLISDKKPVFNWPVAA